MKIACDNHVSLKTMKALKENGYDVVFRAWSESDWNWCKQAVDLKATVFISCDWDIEFFCKQNGFSCIRLPQGKGGTPQATFILNQLEKLKRIF